jgi:exodeoxyribonuclease-3
LNVAHKEIDLANPKTNKTTKSNPGNAGFTDDEREGFGNIVSRGFIDTFREFHSEGGNYSWWSYRTNARERNIGWRIDYICTSQNLKPKLQNASIQPEVMGSDHAPISLGINI